jgi:FixJ family two-component response regulator
MREALETLIGSMGLSVMGFPSAEDFLNAATGPMFDCLILDNKLLGMTGLELQARLLTAGNRIPIIFMTAYFSEEERNKATGAGALAFLSKPFTERELFDAIAIALPGSEVKKDEVHEN